MPRYAILAFLILVLASPVGLAGELRVAAWNLEHLDDTDGEGCLDRASADYAAIARQIEALNADIVAVQEVENVAAVRRVFPASHWDVAMSSRPPIEDPRRCWDRPEARLGHLATGFAIRRGIAWHRNEDLRALGIGNVFQRWGTDITVTEGDQELRLLWVHLRSGCWGAKQDGDTKRKKTCAMLRTQIRHLKAWADARRAEGTAFVILGDFNRRLALKGDWGWELLAPPSASLQLLTEGVTFRCDPRFRAFIDHMIVGGGAEGAADARLVPRDTAPRTASRSLRDVSGPSDRKIGHSAAQSVQSPGARRIAVGVPLIVRRRFRPPAALVGARIGMFGWNGGPAATQRSGKPRGLWSVEHSHSVNDAPGAGRTVPFRHRLPESRPAWR